MKTRIILVNPPVCEIERPSIGLGILKSVLAARGFDVGVRYANLWFAESLGLASHDRLASLPVQQSVADWVFSGVAFPDQTGDAQTFVALIKQRLADMGWRGFDAVAHELVEMRRNAASFVEEAAFRILESDPAIVGCSSTFSQHVASLALLRQIRDVAPGVVTMLGGANCETTMGRATHQRFPWIDYVVSGEAEDIIAPLCEAALAHGPNVAADVLPPSVFVPAHRLSGYPTQAGGDGVPRASMADFQSSPTPDYLDYFVELSQSSFGNNVNPGLLIETSRGCWWGERSHCTFCGLNGGNMTYRAKSAERVLDELQIQSQRYGIDRFQVVDNILNLDYFETLLPALAKTERRYNLFYEIKSNVKRWQIETLERAGVRWVQPGIESLNSRVLKLIGKGVSAAQNILMLKWARQYGVHVFWNIIFGFPGENDTWYEETARLIPYLHHLQPGSPTKLFFNRYSPYHMRQQNFGLRLQAHAPASHIYPLDPADLDDIAYQFDSEESGPSWSRVEEIGRGHRHMLTALGRWRALWVKPPRPVCCLSETGGVATVVDTRNAAGQRRRLSDVEYEVIRGADEGPSVNQLVEQIRRRRDIPAAEIFEAIESLAQIGFVLMIDERVVSVVLRAPVKPLPSRMENPSGQVLDFPDAVAAART